ncbi:hypothetical protein SAMN06298212_105103 [Ruaniaceae bacterium KH17]|nr:hypothetical protein SAMN06298212_105103 [Ruaniaceae bacterium KH17]
MAAATKRVSVVVIAAMMAVLVLAGCDGSSSADSTTDSLPDGVHFGFVTAFADGQLTFTEAELFTGDEAIAEAAKDGEQEPPNDFYLRRSDGDPLTLAVANDASVSVIGSDTIQPTESSVTELAGFFAGEGDIAGTYSFASGVSEFGWSTDITVRDGVVVGLAEYYLP